MIFPQSLLGSYPFATMFYEYVGTLYSVILIIYRHAVFEDDGMIQSFIDIFPFIFSIFIGVLCRNYIQDLRLSSNLELVKLI